MALRPEFDNPRFKQGLAVRREVLGAEYVYKSVQNVEDLMVPMQKMTTEWCWGETWTRGVLDRRTRSMLNLAMLTTLNRPNEIRLHVRGAVNNGVLLRWDTRTVPNGTYLLRLVVVDRFGRELGQMPRIRIAIQN